MDVRIGITQSMRELEVDLGDEVVRETLKADIAAAMANDDGILWLTDKKGREIAVPTAKISFIEIGSPDAPPPGLNAARSLCGAPVRMIPASGTAQAPIVASQGVIQGCPFGSHIYAVAQTMHLDAVLSSSADPSLQGIEPLAPLEDPTAFPQKALGAFADDLLLMGPDVGTLEGMAGTLLTALADISLGPSPNPAKQRLLAPSSTQALCLPGNLIVRPQQATEILGVRGRHGALVPRGARGPRVGRARRPRGQERGRGAREPWRRRRGWRGSLGNVGWYRRC